MTTNINMTGTAQKILNILHVWEISKCPPIHILNSKIPPCPFSYLKSKSKLSKDTLETELWTLLDSGHVVLVPERQRKNDFSSPLKPAFLLTKSGIDLLYSSIPAV